MDVSALDEVLEERGTDQLEERIEKSEEDLSDKEVTQKIRRSIRNKFDAPTWVLVYEFTDRNRRRADALAISTVASRDFPIVGFEFKASRSDWLREKRNHQKADSFVEICDEWYVVAGRRGIVEEDELPLGWGLLELKPAGSLWKLVESDLNDRQDVEPDRRFWAKLMKKVIGRESNFAADDIREARRRGYQDGKEFAASQDNDWSSRERERLETDAKNWRKLKDKGLSGWRELSEERIQRLQRAENLLKYLEEDGRTTFEGDLKGIAERAQMSVDRLDDRIEGVVDELEELREGIAE